jgi:NTE family protein
VDRDNGYGLALSGGAVLGAAHIGALRAIEENNIKISCVAGTSVGAIVAALFAFGKTPQEIEKLAESINFRALLSISLTKLGLFSNIKIAKFIEEQIGNVNIEDAPIPLYIITTDISDLQKVIIKKGNLAQALMASCAVPGIFSPIEFDKKLLVDGGLVENAPLVTLKEQGIEKTITVCLTSRHIHRRPKNLIEVIMNSHSCMLQMFNKECCTEDDIIIAPNLEHFNALKSSEIENIVEVGYKEGMKVLKNIEEKNSRVTCSSIY